MNLYPSLFSTLPNLNEYIYNILHLSADLKARQRAYLVIVVSGESVDGEMISFEPVTRSDPKSH